MSYVLQRNTGRLVTLAAFVVVVVFLAVWFLSGQVNDVLGYGAKPWRLVEAVNPDSRQVRIVADGWACGGHEPSARSTVAYAADTITIAVRVEDLSNCIQQRAVFVHHTVELAQAVGNRQLVDPMAFTPIRTTAPASP